MIDACCLACGAGPASEGCTIANKLRGVVRQCLCLLLDFSLHTGCLVVDQQSIDHAVAQPGYPGVHPFGYVGYHLWQASALTRYP